MFVGSRSPKKPSLFDFFSFLSENVSKWRGSSKSYFRCFFGLFLIGPPLGAPGFIFLDFWAPRASFWHLFGRPGHHFGTLGAHQNDAPAVQNSMKMNPQTDLTAARWRGWANGQMDIQELQINRPSGCYVNIRHRCTMICPSFL